MATDKLWTKQITLFYAGESNPVTIPGLLNSDSSLEVFETTGIAVTVQDASAGTINFTTPLPSFTNITLIAGQDVDWADGNANRATNSLLQNPNLSGVRAGQAFYLVFRDIGGTTPTSGHFYLQREER